MDQIFYFTLRHTSTETKQRVYLQKIKTCKLILYKACSNKVVFVVKLVLLTGTFSTLSPVPFKAVPSTGDKRFPTFLPLLDFFLERISSDGTQFSCRVFLNLLYGLETMFFQSGFKFGKQEKFCWG